MLYRIHEMLLINARQGRFIEGGGCVHSLSTVSKSTIALLLQSGAISIVQAPPLDVFTGWGGRARNLDSLGIDTIGFITMEPRDVAYAICASARKEGTEQDAFDQRVDNLALAVERWQHEIRDNLGIGSATERR